MCMHKKMQYLIHIHLSHCRCICSKIFIFSFCCKLNIIHKTQKCEKKKGINSPLLFYCNFNNVIAREMAEFYVNICHQIDQFSIEMKKSKKMKSTIMMFI